MLKSAEDRLKFFECYNTQYKSVKSKFTLNGTDIHIADVKKINKFKEIIVSNDRSKELIKVLNEILNKEYEFEKAYQLSMKLKSFNNILAVLADAYLYDVLGNTGKAERLIKGILSQELLFHTMNSDIKLMAMRDQISYSISLLEKLQDELESKYVEVLLYYLYTQTTGEFSESLNRKFNINSSLNYTRQNYNSISYGLRFPMVWGPAIFDQGSHVELKVYLEKANVLTDKSEFDGKHLLFLRRFNGIDRKIKDRLIHQMKKIEQSQDYYQKLIYYRILKDDDFYKYIAANMNLKLGLISNSEREFYQSSLSQNQNILFSSVQLLKIGDYSFKTLLKVIAFEAAKL